MTDADVQKKTVDPRIQEALHPFPVKVLRSLVPDAARDDPNVIDNAQFLTDTKNDRQRAFLKMMLEAPTSAEPTGPLIVDLAEKDDDKKRHGASITAPFVALKTSWSREELALARHLDWFGFERNTSLIGQEFDQPYSDDVVGRFLIIEDQFMRFYPPAMVVSLHPNKFIIGVIFLETFDASLETGTAILGSDAFPSNLREDFETYASDRCLSFSNQENKEQMNTVGVPLLPLVSANVSTKPTLLCDPLAEKDNDVKKSTRVPIVSSPPSLPPPSPSLLPSYRVHYLCVPWLRQQLYSGWFEDGPWQFQRFSQPVPDLLAITATATLPVTIKWMDTEKSLQRITTRPEFRQMPEIMGTGILPEHAPSGRKLNHSWPLPYHELTNQELTLANTLWSRFRYPTLEQPVPSWNYSARLIVKRSAAVKAMLLPVDHDDADR